MLDTRTDEELVLYSSIVKSSLSLSLLNKNFKTSLEHLKEVIDVVIPIS